MYIYIYVFLVAFFFFVKILFVKLLVAGNMCLTGQ